MFENGVIQKKSIVQITREEDEMQPSAKQTHPYIFAIAAYSTSAMVDTLQKKAIGKLAVKRVNESTVS